MTTMQDHLNSTSGTPTQNWREGESTAVPLVDKLRAELSAAVARAVTADERGNYLRELVATQERELIGLRADLATAVARAEDAERESAFRLEQMNSLQSQVFMAQEREQRAERELAALKPDALADLRQLLRDQEIKRRSAIEMCDTDEERQVISAMWDGRMDATRERIRAAGGEA